MSLSSNVASQSATFTVDVHSIPSPPPADIRFSATLTMKISEGDHLKMKCNKNFFCKFQTLDFSYLIK